MNDKDVKAYKVLGHSLVFTAYVAAEFPDDFAAAVARWNKEQITEIIEALEKERRALSGNNV